MAESLRIKRQTNPHNDTKYGVTATRGYKQIPNVVFATLWPYLYRAFLLN